MEKEQILFSPAEVADRWGCSPAAIRARLQNGTLKKADVPGCKISYEEVRSHEVILSYGKSPDEKELIARLVSLEEKNKILTEKLKGFRAWRDRVLQAAEEEI